MSRGTAVLTALAAALALGEMVAAASGQVPPGTFAVYGFLGCVAIVVVSKWLGKAGLQRPEPADDE